MVNCIAYFVGSTAIIKKIVSLKIDFLLGNSAGPGEMSHYAAVHPGLHYLQQYPFRAF